jgi:hypothetical protein
VFYQYWHSHHQVSSGAELSEGCRRRHHTIGISSVSGSGEAKT